MMWAKLHLCPWPQPFTRTSCSLVSRSDSLLSRYKLQWRAKHILKPILVLRSCFVCRCVPNCCMHCERFPNFVLIYVIGHISLSDVDYLSSYYDSTWWFAALLSQTSAVVSIWVIAQLPSPVCTTTPTFNFRPSGLLCCSVAARGCLPPGANVCVAAPPIRSVLQSEYFFRISDMGCEPTFGSPLFSLLSPFRPFISHPFPSLR